MYRKNKLLLEGSCKIPPQLNDYDQAVYTAWLVSYKQLKPQVAEFLHFAFRHHEAISVRKLRPWLQPTSGHT
jgi:hypothetical protein